jgi:outer membrane protein assembly factor BamA
MPLQDARLHIRNIIITGNHKTKIYIIEREMQVKKGDSIIAGNLNTELKESKEHIYNTNLFTEVTVKPVIINAFDIDIDVEVKERWYVFPVPQFQLIDRNLNDWIKTFDASLTRVNYGIKFVHYNFSGRRDPLRIYFLNGYSRNFSFSYTAPYSNRALTEGFTVGMGYTQNREISYKTGYNNKVLFYPSDSAVKAKGDFVRNNFNVAASYSTRKGFHKSRYYAANYTFLKIDDSLITAKYNPNYFNNNSSSNGFIDLSYTFQYLDLDKVAYPLSGFSGSYTVSKRGFGITGGVNVFSLLGGVSRYDDLGRKWYSSIHLSGNIKLPFRQAYINQRSLGYGENYLRGMEYYVVDGVAEALAKSTIKYKLLSFKIYLPFKIKSIPDIPITIFAKSFADFGYVYNKNEFKASLNNKLLYTGGFGIDILSLYDLNLRFEYSFNQLGEKGLFLHTQGGF